MHARFTLLCVVFIVRRRSLCFFFFFFNDTATTEIYTLSLHDALPISRTASSCCRWASTATTKAATTWKTSADRKSTRLNSSHLVISYAVFCLKKKKKIKHKTHTIEISRSAQSKRIAKTPNSAEQNTKH